MAQRYEYQDIDGHIILLFVHPAYNYKAEVERYEDKVTHLFLGERGFAIFRVGKYLKEVYSDVCLYENCVYSYEEKDEIVGRAEQPKLHIYSFWCDGKKYQFAHPLFDVYGVDAKTHVRAVKELMNKISDLPKLRKKNSLSATLYKNVSVNKEIIHIDKEKYEVIGESRTHYLFRKFYYDQHFKRAFLLLLILIIFSLTLLPNTKLDEPESVVKNFFLLLSDFILSIYISYKIYSSHTHKYLLTLGDKGFLMQYIKGKKLIKEFSSTYDSLTGYHLEECKNKRYIELRKGNEYCVIEVNNKNKKSTEESIIRTLERKLNDHHVVRK